MTPLIKLVEQKLGRYPEHIIRLSGGCVGDVFKITFKNAQPVVAKTGPAGSNLDVEGRMIKYLQSHSAAPVPDIAYCDDELLLMSWIDSNNELLSNIEQHAATVVSDLHAVKNTQFGFNEATLIGGITQPNDWHENWVDFFRDQRLLYMANLAVRRGRFSSDTMRSIEKLAGRLPRWIKNDAMPCLIHGDVWSGNVICRNGELSGLIDPAIYYADPEIELAFIKLFNTFGEPFFNAYQKHNKIKPGFFEERVDLYNLYPLLVHAVLFGGGYVEQVKKTLKAYGC